MCRILFELAGKKKIPCPIRIYPHCHPRAAIEVFVDVKHNSIILGCARCERTIAKIRVRR